MLTGLASLPTLAPLLCGGGGVVRPWPPGNNADGQDAAPTPHPGQGLRGREEAWPESRLLQGPVHPHFLPPTAERMGCGHGTVDARLSLETQEPSALPRWGA